MVLEKTGSCNTHPEAPQNQDSQDLRSDTIAGVRRPEGTSFRQLTLTTVKTVRIQRCTAR